MKNSRRSVVPALLILLSTVSMNAQELSDLVTIKSGVKSKRVSSYSKMMGNDDAISQIKPGETRVIFDVKETGMINHIWFTMEPYSVRNDIIVRMYWDDNDEPSVLSPLGSFFGQGWNETYAFTSLPLVASPVNGTASVSYFKMPFEGAARIEIENQSDVIINSFYFYIDYVAMDKLPKNTGRFHAWYNHETTEAHEIGENEWFLLGINNDDYLNENPRENNYLIADIKGKGHFVGVNYYVHSPGPLWYGEGDDMIFIDDDPDRTLFGTGTEDYFNTSWGPKQKFDHEYFGAARVNKETGYMGRTHVYRFHIADPLFFDKSMKFTIEHGNNNSLTLDLASVAYWYQDEAVAVPAIANKEERKPKSFNNAIEIHKWRNEWRKNSGGDRQLWGDEK